MENYKKGLKSCTATRVNGTITRHLPGVLSVSRFVSAWVWVAVENSPEAQEDGLVLGREAGDLVEAWVGQVDLVQHCVVAQLLVLNRQNPKQ